MPHTTTLTPSSNVPFSSLSQANLAFEDGMSGLRALDKEDTLIHSMSNLTINKPEFFSHSIPADPTPHPTFIIIMQRQYQPPVSRPSRSTATSHRTRSSLSLAQRGLPTRFSPPRRPRGPMQLVHYRVVRPQGSSAPVAIRVPTPARGRVSNMKHQGALRRHESFLVVEPMDIDADAM